MNRRQLLGWAAGAATGTIPPMTTSLALQGPRVPTPRRPRVAAVVTEFTYRSHAHVILENFLEPYYFNGVLTAPGVEVAALYVDQFPEGDMARECSRRYGVPLYPTIGEALRLGGNTLAVDGVLSIGEHGDYPVNERGQRMYPRKRFFDESVAVLRASGRAVPLFNDKHLSYRWDWAAEMTATAKALSIPLMAGSSVPLAERRPPLELPPNAALEEAVAVHGGPLESYDFHALEVLQSLVEGRRGGETGVSEVQLLEGEAVWEAARAGRWSASLAKTALRAELGKEPERLEELWEAGDGRQQPVHAILLRYRDGFRGTVLRLGRSSTRWGFACRLAGRDEPLATRFYVGPWQNRNLFKALAHAIQCHVREGRAPYPLERTLLTTGALAAAMDSRFEGHRPVATPHLELAYRTQDFRRMREMGATWKLLTEDVPEPEGINPGRPRP